MGSPNPGQPAMAWLAFAAMTVAAWGVMKLVEQGKIDLEDLGLDARGEIKLGEELTRSIARTIGLKEMPLMQAIVIPIPRLRGTISDPRPEPDFTFLFRALTANLPGAKGVQKLMEGLDGVLRQPTQPP